jgi:hypothetical protein
MYRVRHFILPLSTRAEERARLENSGPWCWKWVLGPWAFEDTYLIICVVLEVSGGELKSVRM